MSPVLELQLIMLGIVVGVPAVFLIAVFLLAKWFREE
jgi:hypothetical protein